MNKKQEQPLIEAKASGGASDLIITSWIIVVGFTYFGPMFYPSLGKDAIILAPVYALMVLLSVLSLFMRYSSNKNEHRK